MDLSILIVTYNAQFYIDKCVNSILNQKTDFKYEIVIVDNFSDDSTCQYLDSIASPAKIIKNKYNYGFSVSMNQAYRASSGKYVMTFNPDAEMEEGVIQKLVKIFEENIDIGLIAGVVRENGAIAFPNSKFSLFENSKVLGTLTSKLFKNNSSSITTIGNLEVDFVSGTGLTVRRILLKEDRMFEENSFLFWEEYYLCKRIKELKHNIIISSEIVFNHAVSTSFKFDKEKLKMAVLLSHVHSFRVRRDAFGKTLTLTSYIANTIDNAFFCFFLKLKSLFSSKSEERNRSILISYTQIIANILLIARGIRVVNEIDTKAKLFFNRKSHKNEGK